MPVSHHVLINIDEDGAILCFCPYESYLLGDCGCRGKNNCPEATLEITVLPNSRPSDQTMGGIKQITRDLKQMSKNAKKANDRIKQGVAQIEKVVRSNRWRI